MRFLRSPQGSVTLKQVTLLLLIAPALWLASAFYFDLLGAKPMERLIEEVGSFAIRFLLLSLLISPARSLLHWPALIAVRRRIGLASFFYGLAHLILFAVDREFGPLKLIIEIFSYTYLTIGFVALVALLPLALTSSNRMIAYLGARRWRWLHRTIYGIAPIALLHFFLESPRSSIEPFVLGGCLFWLLAYRMWQQLAPVRLSTIIVLGLAATVATALAEALFFALKLGAPIANILIVNLGFSVGVRPAQMVLCLGFLLVLTTALGADERRPRSRRHPAGAATRA